MNAWLIIISTLIASAFFSGMEIAFITANKLRIELESKNGNQLARIISYFNNYSSRFLGALLLGNNIALVIFGIYMADVLKPYIALYVSSSIGLLLIQTLLATLLILVAAEFIPKNVFRINPNRILNFFAVPLLVIYWVMYPIVFLIIGFTEFVLKSVFKVKIENEQLAFGRVDLDNYVREGTKEHAKNEDAHEIRIFKNALDFARVKARECMVPRTEIIALDVNDSIGKLKDKFLQTRLSKILIYDRSIDNIIGYVHSHELFQQPDLIRSILLPVSIVPESMHASEILTLFIQQRRSIAVVVDEFGGTSGMLTMEDVMEEIFGEIEDEHDKEELIEKKISELEYVFSGRLEIDYLNETYQLNLPSFEDYETLSGLIMYYHQSIPRVNEEILIEQFSFKIITVIHNRIEQVQLRIIEA